MLIDCSPVDSQRGHDAPLPVIVVADDLIWSSRLTEAVHKAGTTSVVVRSAKELDTALTGSKEESPVVIDLNGRAFDGVHLVEVAAEEGHPVIAVGQHEDIELRKRALGAGAIRVFSYNKLFSDGPAVIARLLEGEL
jgi:DNA-binding NtrC family response regulator